MNKTEITGSGPTVLRRGLRILGVLRQAGMDSLHVMEIARLAGMQRSTVYRYLDVLVEEGYVLREQDGPWYRFVDFSIPSGIDPHAGAIRQLQPVLRRISDALGDASFLICRVGDDALCLHRELGSYPVQALAVAVGHRQPLGVGSAGLALLAAMPPEEARELIAHNERSMHAYGRMTGDQMRKLVDNTRARGWSVVGNSAVPGMLGVGVALCDNEGYPRFSISVSSLIDRMPAKRQHVIAEVIRREVKSLANGRGGLHAPGD